MSGSAGGQRITRSAVEATVKDYIDRVLSKFKGFKSAKVSGSYNYSDKQDFGDLDLIVFIEGEDKKQVKDALADYLQSLPDDIIVPFKSEKYKGKKLLKPGELVTILYPITGVPGEFVQIDNIVAISQQEEQFKQTFLDVPAATQGLILGLVKAATVEEDPQRIFKRLGIQNIPTPQENQEYDFNLSGDKLSLRLVTLGDGYKELGREVVWTSQNWSDVEKLLSNYNLNVPFEDLLQQVKSNLKSERGKNRVKGIFRSMVSVKSGEVGTPKGDDKEKALSQVAALESKYSKLTMELIKPFLTEQQYSEAIAVFPGAFKPPHKSHFEVIKTVAPKVDKVKVYVSKQPRGEEGQTTITQDQALRVWDIYKQYLPDNVEIIAATNPTPVLDAYQEIEGHPDNKYLAIYGKGEESRWKAIEKNPTKYGHVQTTNLGDIEGVSATKLRTALAQGDDTQAVNYLPNMSKEDTMKVLDILKTVMQEFVTRRDLEDVERVADTELAPVDVSFERHFMDRVNDPRNTPEISKEELLDFFKKLAQKQGALKSLLNKSGEVVVKDPSKDLNTPIIATQKDKTGIKQITPKTIMRKKNFQTPNKTIFVEKRK
jgi:hypothetical protein